MKYINNATTLKAEFKRLMNAYDNYHWMVAWAGQPFDITNTLMANEEKIRKVVVGLHFYQTHPDFIDAFHEQSTVRFIQSTTGTFHPKVYLFSNNNESWELILGSSNFTNAGFGINNEASLLIHSGEADATMYEQVLNSINASWEQGKQFDDDEKEGYRRHWVTQQNKLLSLERYQEEKTSAPFPQIPVVRRNWREYIARMIEANGDSIEERLRVLDFAQEYFSTYPVFAEMPPEYRKRISGFVAVNQPANFHYFGNMQRAMTFKSKINRTPELIGYAIDVIPFKGEVTREQYDLFVTRFNAAVDGGNKYVSATRLLAMKRPDVFFCLSSGNTTLLSEDFAIQNIAGMTLTRYWDEIIGKISESSWYQHPEQSNEIEERIVPYRAAFMDAVYYQQED